MTKNKLVLSAVALSMVFSAGIVGLSYAAEQVNNDDQQFQDQPQFQQRGHRHGDNEAKREAIKEAVTNGDYEAWAELMKCPMADKINPDTFAKLQEADALMEAGDTEAARAIMEELGIGPKGRKQGQRQEKRQEVHEAVVNNDYAAWAEAVANHPAGEEFINEETFSLFRQAWELKEAGDIEGARAIMEELKPDRGERPERGGRPSIDV